MKRLPKDVREDRRRYPNCTEGKKNGTSRNTLERYGMVGRVGFSLGPLTPAPYGFGNVAMGGYPQIYPC